MQRLRQIKQTRAHQETQRSLHLVVSRPREVNATTGRAEPLGQRRLERGVAIFLFRQ